MTQNNSVWCIAPFSSLYTTNSKVGKPCCVITGRDYKILDFTKDINWNFNHANSNLRKEFIAHGLDADKHDKCVACNVPDERGMQRVLHNKSANPSIDYIQNPTLTNLHVKFSNLCNLACRMCDPLSSNLLFKEDKNYAIRSDIIKDSNYVVRNIPKDSVFYKSIFDNAANLRYIWFSGGETLLHEEVWEILNHLHDKGYSKNVDLHINTNGTVKLTEQEIRVIQSFKSLNFHVSIDGIGKLGEYVRTNLVWNKWLENFKTYHEEFKNAVDFNITATISTLNIHKAGEIHNYFNSNFKINPILNFVYGFRKELVAYNINDRAKQYLYDLYKDDNFNGPNIINFLKHDRTMEPSEIIREIDKRDDHVISNNIYKNYIPFREVEPEWYNMLRS